MTRNPKATNRFAHSGPPLPTRLLALLLAAAALALLVLAPVAQASKQVVDQIGGGLGKLGGQFGTDVEGVAVNESGAGPASSGDLYAIDANNNRIERFGRDDNGTPADNTDDTYFFISAWGADVDSVPSGGSEYEICTVASECTAAAAAASNGTLGRGAASGLKASSLAIDQDTGDVYVADGANFRVNVYEGGGIFLRSFGFDVVASGPDNAGTGYEVCVAANGDICKAGIPGAGIGQIDDEGSANHSVARGIAVSPPDGNVAGGTVFLADGGNRRIDTYKLDGSSPSSIGSGAIFFETFPVAVAVDSRGVVYASNRSGPNVYINTPQIERYDTENADGNGVGFLAPILSPTDERQTLSYNATAGQYRLSFDPDGGGPQPPETTGDLAFNANPDTVEAALKALPSIGPESVRADQIFDNETEHILITFTGKFTKTNVAQLVLSNGTIPLTGTIPVESLDGHTGALDEEAPINGLAVDPDSDGSGPDSDVLYALTGESILQFGPLNSAGLSAPPVAFDDRHDASGASGGPSALSIEPSTGRLYVSAAAGVFVLDNVSPTPPTASIDSLTDVTSHSLTAHATVDPNGPPNSSYHFEYSSDGVEWVALPTVVLGHQEDPQAVEATIDPPPIGLDPSTLYHVRLVAGRKFATPVVTSELAATTGPAAPLAETTGTAVRTTTTAQLTGRVAPRGSATTYHFEYGAEGPCDVDPCATTPDMPAGAGGEFELVAEEIEGLEPQTTYHYRLIADNGNPSSPDAGSDMTVTTRASDAPLSHGHFPGPPGSDRAYELVSLPDSSGNPINAARGISDDGNRTVYSISGGTPAGDSGSVFSFYYSERTASGWQSRLISPPRDQLVGPDWGEIYGASDLSRLVSGNLSGFGGISLNKATLWSLSPTGQPMKLFEPGSEQELAGNPVINLATVFGTSADAKRVAAMLIGPGLDPLYPTAGSVRNLYDISSGAPRLLSLMPDNAPAACGVAPLGALGELEDQAGHWVSADGLRIFFTSRGDGPCQGSEAGPAQLYMRDIGAEATESISGLPLSGPSCSASFLKSTPGAVFFTTASRLDPADAVSATCEKGNDVYRFDYGDGAGGGSLRCVTCVGAGGVDANVIGDRSLEVAVSDDGSRVYFATNSRLLAGAPPNGKVGAYRVDVASGDLAYVGPLPERTIGSTSSATTAYSSDGRFFAFISADPFFNPLGSGGNNGGTEQVYLYDDKYRSVSCVSCPPDGSPAGEEDGFAFTAFHASPNLGPLTEDGTLAFKTRLPLVGADQNTPPAGRNPGPGTDIYEWRDGRPLLVTDGLTSWPEVGGAPNVEGVSPSGRDIFFVAAARYTPDAIDSYTRLYDARIGGGIPFAPPPPPCPLEVCQGTPRGAPEELPPSSSLLRGSGNKTSAPARCAKGKVRRKGRCAKRSHKRSGARHHRANHKRRAQR